MDMAELERAAGLIHKRNAIDRKIGAITGRPVVAGHLGEWIAAQIFEIGLEASAVAKALDGHFTVGPLAGKTVNIKWYGMREGLLDMVDDPAVDYYLVMTGPPASAGSSRGGTRPLAIDAVYLFEALALLAHLRARGVQIGIATSLTRGLWDAAECYPSPHNPALRLTSDQHRALALFSTRHTAST
jgi:hypothetical protein